MSNHDKSTLNLWVTAAISHNLATPSLSQVDVDRGVHGVVFSFMKNRATKNHFWSHLITHLTLVVQRVYDIVHLKMFMHWIMQ